MRISAGCARVASRLVASCRVPPCATNATVRPYMLPPMLPGVRPCASLCVHVRPFASLCVEIPVPLLSDTPTFRTTYTYATKFQSMDTTPLADRRQALLILISRLQHDPNRPVIFRVCLEILASDSALILHGRTPTVMVCLPGDVDMDGYRRRRRTSVRSNAQAR